MPLPGYNRRPCLMLLRRSSIATTTHPVMFTYNHLYVIHFSYTVTRLSARKSMEEMDVSCYIMRQGGNDEWIGWAKVILGDYTVVLHGGCP